jgi:two-component system sensor histidine kinase HydH
MSVWSRPSTSVPLLGEARVLVVDDHEELVGNLTTILEGEGARVIPALCGAEALERALAGFDVALVDILLPDMNGLSLLSELHQAGDGCGEIVLITGDSSLELAVEAVGRQAFAYVIKPLDGTELTATVDRALQKARLQRRSRELERRTRIAEKLAFVGVMSAGLTRSVHETLGDANRRLEGLQLSLQREHDEPEFLEPVVAVQIELGRLLRLVEDFLCFAQPAELDLQPFDLKALVQHVLAFVRPVAAPRGIALVAEFPAGCVNIVADREKFRQVVFSVVHNALEVLEDGGGNIFVSLAWADECTLLLRIRDDGPGVSESILPQIFDPFFSTKPMGTGLSMAICYSIVQQHGGVIEVSCEGGTTVDILLPTRADMN